MRPKALYRVQLSNTNQKKKKRFNVPGKNLKVIKRTRETSVQTIVEDDETESIKEIVSNLEYETSNPFFIQTNFEDSDLEDSISDLDE